MDRDTDIVDHLCDKFEAECQCGLSPEIQSWLHQAPTSKHETLFFELLTIELEYRVRRGDTPQPADYSAFAISWPQAIRNAFEYIDLGDSGPSPPPAENTLPVSALDEQHKDGAPSSKTLRTTEPDLPAQERGVRSLKSEGVLIGLNDYEIIEVIGHGGMGVVYRARQVSANRDVALKVVRDGREIDTEAVLRMRREAQAAAQLSHDNIVQVHDVGEVDGIPYFSMQLIDGQSLARKLDNGPLADRTAASVMETVCRAIGFSHQNDILHRDIKPSNILIAEDGRPYVSDFGLAKASNEDQTLTQTGDIIGTAMYMAPEQASGAEQCSVASDVYSIGATLYEAITGRPAFRGSTTLETLMMVMKQVPVAPRQLNSGIHKDIETITLKCLEKEPAKRYATAGELADDLRRFLNNKPVNARPVSWIGRTQRWSRRHPAVAVLLTLLVIAICSGVGGSLWMWREAVVARDEAVDRGNAATTAQIAESAAKDEAVTAQQLAQRQVARLKTTTGLQLMSEGRLVESLRWSHEALDIYEALASAAEQSGDSELARTFERNADLQRRRLAATVFRAPQLVATWKLPEAATKLVSRNFDSGNLIGATFTGPHVIITHSAQRNNAGIGTNHPKHHPMRFDAMTGKPVPFEFDVHKYRRVQISRDGKWAFAETAKRISLLNLDDASIVNAADKRTLPARRLLEWDGAENGDWPFPVLDGRFSSSLTRGNPLYSPYSSCRDGRRGVIRQFAYARVWDAATHREHRREVSFGKITPTISSDGKLVAGQQYTPGFFVWDVDAGVDYVYRKPHNAEVIRLAFDPSNRWLLTASRDQVAHVWRVSDLMGANTPFKTSLSDDGQGRPVINSTFEVLPGTVRPLATVQHSSGWQSISFSPDGEQFVAAEDGRSVRIFQSSTGTPVTPTLPHPSPVSIVVWELTGQRLLVVGIDGVVRIWELATIGDSIVMPLAAPATVVQFSRDGTLLAGGSADGTCQAWDTRNGVAFGVPIKGDRPVLDIEWDRHAERLAITTGTDTGERIQHLSHANRTQVWDVVTGEPKSEVFGSFGDAIGTGDVTFRPHKDEFAIQFANSVKVVKDPLASTQAVVRHPGAETNFGHLPFSPDGKRFATASTGRVVVWDARTGKAQTGFSGPNHHDTAVLRFGPKNRLVLAAGNFGFYVWDSLLEEFRMQRRGSDVIPIAAAGFDATGTRLVTARANGECRVWNLETGRNEGEFISAGGEPMLAEFCGNSRQVVTVLRKGEIRVWDVASGESISPRWQHGAGLRDAVLDANNWNVASAGVDGFVRLWRLQPTLDSDGFEELARTQLALQSVTPTGESDVLAQSVTAPSAATVFHLNRAQACRHSGNIEAAKQHLNSIKIDSVPSTTNDIEAVVRVLTPEEIRHLQLRELKSLGAFDDDVPAIASERPSVERVAVAAEMQRLRRQLEEQTWVEALNTIGRLRTALPDDPVIAMGACAVAGHLDEQRSPNERVAETYRDASRTLLDLADAYPTQNQPDLSPALIRAALARPLNADLLASRLWELHRQLHRQPDGLRQALLGALQFRLGLFDLAVKTLEQAVAIQTTDGLHGHWARCFLAMAQHQLGKQKEAEHTLSLARASIASSIRSGGTDAIDVSTFAAIDLATVIREATAFCADSARAVPVSPQDVLSRHVESMKRDAETEGWRLRSKLADVLKAIGEHGKAKSERLTIVKAEGAGESCAIFNGLDGGRSSKAVDLNRTPFTVEAWIKDWNGPLLLQGEDWADDSPVTGEPYYFMRLANGRVECGWNLFDEKDHTLQFQLPAGLEWIHVAEVFDGKGHYLFVNGETVAARSPLPMNGVSLDREALIGQYTDGQTATGLLRSLHVCRRVLYQGKVPFEPAPPRKNEDTLLLLDCSH